MRGKLIIAVIFIVFVSVSFILAKFSEFLALATGCVICTPGMAVGHRLVPIDQTHAVNALARVLAIATLVDAPIWFLVLGGITLVIILRYRRKHRPLPDANITSSRER
jgi:hypothetical protein